MFTATFIGLLVFTCYYAWQCGWISKPVATVAGAVFFLLWIWVPRAGGWVLTASGA